MWMSPGPPRLGIASEWRGGRPLVQAGDVMGERKPRNVGRLPDDNDFSCAPVCILSCPLLQLSAGYSREPRDIWMILVRGFAEHLWHKDEGPEQISQLAEDKVPGTRWDREVIWNEWFQSSKVELQELGSESRCTRQFQKYFTGSAYDEKNCGFSNLLQ